MTGSLIEGHLLSLPIVIPLTGAFLSLLLHRRSVMWQRVVSIGATVALLAVAIMLLLIADRGGYTVYRLGDWPVPVAIVLVLDRIAALMILLTAAVGVFSVWHAVHGTDAEGAHYHALFQLQLAGICGAFLAGDLFNLFVFFEILLIASYCLLVYGGTIERVRRGVHYVVLNLVGSSLFLVAIGILYGLLGTLNLAQLAERVAQLGADDAGLVRSAALLLVSVFALKAAVAPMSFWLPGAYATAAPPIAAIFALMTKVGVYSIIRVSTVLFGPDAGVAANVIAPWMLPAAILTIAVGALGASAAPAPRRVQGYLLIVSVGTMLAAASAFTVQGVSATLFYLTHSTLVTAAMFLLAGATRDRRTETTLVGALFFVGATALAGLPPWSGFIGKVLILQSAPPGNAGVWMWGAVLISSGLAVIALAKVGIELFWEPRLNRDDSTTTMGARQPVLPATGLLSLVLLLTVFAGPASRFAARASEQLLHPHGYARAVLDISGGR